MNKLPLTICILTNRADSRFIAALKSAQIAEEVLVIDDHSGNDWEAVRARFSCMVLEKHEPITDYAAVRNEALRHAQYDWVFFLDSDEVITAQSPPELHKIITENTAETVVIRRSDVFHGYQLEYGEAGNQPIVRLGKKHALEFTGSVHEVVIPKTAVQYSTIQVLHHSHPNISEFIEKVSTYARQVAAERSYTLPRLLLELILYPPAKFIHSLFFQAGSQDGWYGLVYAACMSLHSLLVRIYAYEKLQRTADR